MTKFLQYLESSGKFRKNFSAKYKEVYILVLILWKTNRLVHSPTVDKKIEENLPKMTKIAYKIFLIFGISRHILGKHFP